MRERKLNRNELAVVELISKAQLNDLECPSKTWMAKKLDLSIQGTGDIIIRLLENKIIEKTENGYQVIYNETI